MKKVLGFYRTFFQTLNPRSYEGFSESTVRNTFNYFFSLIFNALLLMLVLMIPAVVHMPSNLATRFNNIDTFTFNIDFKTNAPLTFPEQHPLLIINYANSTPNEKANIILNNNILYYGFGFKQYEKDFSSYKDAKAKSSEISTIATVLLLLIAPTLLLIAYFYMLIKFFIIAIAASVIGMILAMLIGYRVRYKNIFNTAIYGISATIFIGIIFFALDFSFYGIQYLPLLIYMIIGIKTGKKIDNRNKNKYLEVK